MCMDHLEPQFGGTSFHHLFKNLPSLFHSFQVIHLCLFMGVFIFRRTAVFVFKIPGVFRVCEFLAKLFFLKRTCLCHGKDFKPDLVGVVIVNVVHVIFNYINNIYNNKCLKSSKKWQDLQ